MAAGRSEEAGGRGDGVGGRGDRARDPIAPHVLTRAEARRIAVRAQLLARPRPTDVLDVGRRLTRLQADPTAAIAPSADLVLWSRLGAAYDPQELRDLVEEQRLVDLHMMLRPAEDLALFRPAMAVWPGVGPLTDWQVRLRDWVRDNDACREEILALLRTDGPLPAKELPDTCVRPWSSSGWNHRRNVTMMLDFLVQRGEVAAAGRDGRDRLWDLASRVYPDGPGVPYDESLARRRRRWLEALGIARARGPEDWLDGVAVGEAGEPAVVLGVRGTWRVDPAQLGRPFRGRVALLSPLDQLVLDRKRLAELFEFDYQLEMYKPAHARRWGYWAMPILYGDRLVGKLDATADRSEGVLRVAGVHRDVVFTQAMTRAVDREIRALATWLELDLDLPA